MEIRIRKRRCDHNGQDQRHQHRLVHLPHHKPPITAQHTAQVQATPKFEHTRTYTRIRTECEKTIQTHHFSSVFALQNCFQTSSHPLTTRHN
jgi:hypothetical protein